MVSATATRNTATSTVDAAAETTKQVLAERYKTKPCRNWLQTGNCPYETRCMFAHGDGELRTKEMNLRDGLTTEDAIRAFKRAQSHGSSSSSNRYHAHSSSAVATAASTIAAASNANVVPTPEVTYTSPATQSLTAPPCACADCARGSSPTQAGSPSSQQYSSEWSGVYVFDPYSWSQSTVTLSSYPTSSTTYNPPKYADFVAMP